MADKNVLSSNEDTQFDDSEAPYLILHYLSLPYLTFPYLCPPLFPKLPLLSSTQLQQQSVLSDVCGDVWCGVLHFISTL